MPIDTYYPAVRLVHVGCVACSGCLFAVRGVQRIRGRSGAGCRSVRLLSYAIDSVLLFAAILLALSLGEYPLVTAWLNVKVSLLAVYILLGHLALKRAPTRRGQIAAFAAALMVFGCIVGVAVTHRTTDWRVLWSDIRPTARAAEGLAIARPARRCAAGGCGLRGELCEVGNEWRAA